VTTEIKIGQVWQEVDPRFTGPHKTVIGFAEDGRVITTTGAKTTKSKRERFNGKRGGYKLIREA
jgi:hypothetical protein